jgi:hypothetical protein
MLELKRHVLSRYEAFKASPPSYPLPEVGCALRPQFNLFSTVEEDGAPPVWFEFRRWVDKTYRDYLTETTGMKNASDLKIVARAIPGHFKQREKRTPPHYHHTCDHVMITYLDCGENRTPYELRDWTIGDGELILQDPRPMGGFPFWDKVKYIDTNPGLVVIHPSRLWHETNGFHSDGDRVLIAVTMRVESHNYFDIYETL